MFLHLQSSTSSYTMLTDDNNVNYLPLVPKSIRKTVRRRDKSCILATFICGVALIWTIKRFKSSGFLFAAPAIAMDMYQDLNQSPILHGPPYNATPHERAVVTSLYTDPYTYAIATLGHSLKEANVDARKIVAYIPDRITERALCVVKAAGWEPYPVQRIPPPHNGENIHPWFVDQYTKLSIWKLDDIGIKTAIYLDADTLVRRNFDELWNIPFEFGAVPDVYLGEGGFTVGFNAGVLMLHPSTETFSNMMSNLESAKHALRDAEQGFLNVYFGAQAVRLPYVYGGNLAIKKRSTEMWKAMEPEMRVVHYTLVKPFEADPKCEGQTSCPPEVVFDTDRHKKYIQEAKKRWEGIFVEELGWWEDTYNGVIKDIDGIC